MFFLRKVGCHAHACVGMLRNGGRTGHGQTSLAMPPRPCTLAATETNMVIMNGPSASRQARIKILFLCTGNSCRSQMAEGWARMLKGDLLEPYSAGIEARGLDPRAVTVMGEAGVDIGGQRSKRVEQLGDVPFDAVVTVCEHARKNCPLLPGIARQVHVAFDDPPRLAQAAATEEEALAHYRRVRDEIRAFVERLPEGLGETA